MQCCARAILAIKNPGHEPGIIIDSQLHSEIHNHFLAYIKDHYMPETDTHKQSDSSLSTSQQLVYRILTTRFHKELNILRPFVRVWILKATLG